MAQPTLLLLAAFILTCQPLVSEAGDVFTGFQIDNRSQYFGYFGVRTPLLQTSGGPDLFVQTLAAGIGYRFKSDGQLLDANVQFIVQALGITKTVGSWILSAQAGPQLRRIEEQRLSRNASIEHQIGAYGQVDALYSHEKGSVHVIGSYADLDNFFWGRLRGKLLTHQSTARCSTYVGWDVAGMGNADSRAVQTGPLVEVPIEKVFLLAKGGYQYGTSFHGSVYGGIEIYFPF